MAEWIWILALFAALTVGYIAGFATGSFRADRAPTPTAWLKAKEYDCDCRKEIALQTLRNENEWEMEALKRGIYDHIPFDEDDNDDAEE